MSYSELQNGSDIRGIALENETGEKVNLTDKAACDIAAAFTRKGRLSGGGSAWPWA